MQDKCPGLPRNAANRSAAKTAPYRVAGQTNPWSCETGAGPAGAATKPRVSIREAGTGRDLLLDRIR